MTTRAVYKRRERLAQQGIILESVPNNAIPTPNNIWSRQHSQIKQRLEVGIENGVVVVFSDAHYWPGIISPAHKALVSVVRTLKPVIVIANGDILDGASISRHDPDGWETKPNMLQELEASKARMDEIEAAAGLDTMLLWNQGNHDARFERYLAINAPQFAGMPGSTLAEHFPRWQYQMSTMVNVNRIGQTMIKHRHRNGVHATYNNTVSAGINIVTGHLHRLNVTAWGDYRGRRYGVDTGTLADPHGPQFTYGEDGPTPHASGFAVLTYRDGILTPPELCEVVGTDAYFRAERVAI